MTVEYQDFGIGRVNANTTVNTPKPKKEDTVEQDSEQVVRDIRIAFDLDYYINEYTGTQNIQSIFNAPLSLKVSLLDTGITNSILFYQKKVSWGKRKHKNWLPMFARVSGNKTILGQLDGALFTIFVIVKGKIISQEQGRSNNPVAELISQMETY